MLLVLSFALTAYAFVLYRAATVPLPVPTVRQDVVEVILPFELVIEPGELESLAVTLSYQPGGLPEPRVESFAGVVLTVAGRFAANPNPPCVPYLVRAAHRDSSTGLTEEGTALLQGPTLPNGVAAPDFEGGVYQTWASPDAAPVFVGRMCAPPSSGEVRDVTYFQRLASGEVRQRAGAVLYQLPSLRVYAWSRQTIVHFDGGKTRWGGPPPQSAAACTTAVLGTPLGRRIESMAPPTTNNGLEWTGCDTGEKTALLIDVRADRAADRQLFIAGSLLGFAGAVLVYAVELLTAAPRRRR